MAVIILPDRWRNQPAGPITIDYSHPAAAGLVHVCAPTLPTDPVTGQTWAQNGTAVDLVPGIGGIAFANAANPSSFLYVNDSVANSCSKAIIVSVCEVASGSGDYSPFSKRLNYNQGWQLHTRFSGLKGNDFPTFCFYDGSWRSTTGTIDIRGTGPRALVGAYDGATLRCFVDGLPQGESSFSGSLPDTSAVVSVAGYVEYAQQGRVYVAYLIDGNKVAAGRELSQELSRAPWAIFKKRPRILYFPSAAGGAYTLTAGSGSFSLTGTAATLKVGRVLSCGSGSFALSGTAATLKSGKVLAAASGSYALTGTAATLKAGRLLSAASGTYAVSGTAADLRKSAILAATSGSFALTGTAATLTYTPAGSYSLSADSGSYTLNGTTVALKVGRILPAASGSYAFTGTNVTLSRGRTMAAASGSFTLTGTNISVARSYVLTASSGSFALSGSDVSLTYSGAPVVVPPTTGGGGGPMIIKERGLRDELARIRKEREEAALRRQIQREDEEIVLIMAALAA